MPRKLNLSGATTEPKFESLSHLRGNHNEVFVLTIKCHGKTSGLVHQEMGINGQQGCGMYHVLGGQICHVCGRKCYGP